MYRVIFAKPAAKDLEKIAKREVVLIIDKIEMLEENPRPAGTKKLKGHFNLWRIRVGNYRVIYSILDAQQAVDIIRIAHRKDIYREI